MLEVGSTIKRGRWRIDRQLASGGVATVFAATHTNGKRAALKVLSEAFVDDVEMRERFLREGYAANAVGHAGVVNILDDDFDDGIAYLVMELLEGEALDRRFERLGRRLPLSEVLRIGDALLDVLAAAHEKGIVHRDIKPANLFMLSDGSLKVLDFGFAKIKQSATESTTTVGSVLGTPGFVAPERLVDTGREIDARTDIWSVGATLFLLASGKPVVESENVAMTLHATATAPVRSLATVAPSLPIEFVAIVDRALAFDPDDRWPSAEAMRDALREVSDDEPTRVGNVRPLPSTIPPTPSLMSEPPADEPTKVYSAAHARTLPAPPDAVQAAEDAITQPPPAKKEAAERPSDVPRVADDEPLDSRGHTVVMPAPSSPRLVPAAGPASPASHRFAPPSDRFAPPSAPLPVPAATPSRGGPPWLVLGAVVVVAVALAIGVIVAFR